MSRIAVTGCSSRFAQVLLPLLQSDAEIEQIVGIDIVPPTGTYSKLQFHKKDVRDTSLKEVFTGCDTVIKHDLPGAYNVVGDGPDTLPNIARSAGVQVIEVPHDTIVQAVTASWQGGQTVFGPEWVSGEGAVICSNEKLKKTGLWRPRYTTTEAYAATVAAVS